jgi:hypothetical protein
MIQEPEAVYRTRNDGLTWRKARDEIVILDLNTSVYFGLDRSATLLWHKLLAGATAKSLTAVLVGGTTVEPERATADVSDFLDQMSRYGLIHQL